MDKRIIKTVLILITSMVVGLIIPIIGQFYTQKTGIEPYALYFVGCAGGAILTLISILKVWGEIK